VADKLAPRGMSEAARLHPASRSPGLDKARLHRRLSGAQLTRIRRLFRRWAEFSSSKFEQGDGWERLPFLGVSTPNRPSHETGVGLTSFSAGIRPIAVIQLHRTNILIVPGKDAATLSAVPCSKSSSGSSIWRMPPLYRPIRPARNQCQVP